MWTVSCSPSAGFDPFVSHEAHHHFFPAQGIADFVLIVLLPGLVLRVVALVQTGTL